MNNMKIYCLGDSLTEGDYGIAGKSGIGNVKDRGYPYFLAAYTSAETVNCGRCGATAKSYLDFLQDENVSLNGANVIVLMLGSNGCLTTDKDSRDNLSYHGIIDYCKQNAPDALLVLCTPSYATKNPAYSNCGYLPRVIKAAEAVREIASAEALPLIDVFSYPEICEENVPLYQSADGLHFNERGYRLLAQFIFHELKKYIPRARY